MIADAIEGSPVTMQPLIAIVDNDAAVLEATKYLVETMGFRTETFASAKAFLGSNAARTAACLLLDVQMPGIDGIQLQQRLIRANCDLPIIFITGFRNEHVRRRALDSGAIAFLSKPLGRDVLLQSIQLALRDKSDDAGC